MDVIGLALRSVRRLLARYRSAEEAAALLHGNTGRTSGNRLSDDTRARLVELASSFYGGANRTPPGGTASPRARIWCCRPARCAGGLGEAGVPATRRRRPRLPKSLTD